MRELVRWCLLRRGLLTSNVIEAAAFIRTRPGLAAPDVELLFGPVMWADEGRGTPPAHGFTIGPVALTPGSRGHLGLQAADPAHPPIIHPNFLAHEDDLSARVAGVRLCRRIVAAPALAAFAPEEQGPTAGARTDDELAEAVRACAQTAYHPIGSCRMGRDRLAVVDEQLRVHGIEGLRVADVSVVPMAIRGHTQAAAYLVGERAAELIRRPEPTHSAARMRSPVTA